MLALTLFRATPLICPKEQYAEQFSSTQSQGPGAGGRHQCDSPLSCLHNLCGPLLLRGGGSDTAQKVLKKKASGHSVRFTMLFQLDTLKAYLEEKVVKREVHFTLCILLSKRLGKKDRERKGQARLIPGWCARQRKVREERHK